MNGKKNLTPHRRLLSVQSKISNTNNRRDIMPRIFHFVAKFNKKVFFVQIKCCLTGLKLSIEFSFKLSMKDC